MENDRIFPGRASSFHRAARGITEVSLI
jgi:hypothetical protein